MNKSNDNTDNAAQRAEQTGSASSLERTDDTSLEELVQTHLDTFTELADSDLPIAEDAEKAIALTNGGEDQ